MAQILKTRRASKGIFTNASKFVLLMLLLLSSISRISSTSASNLKSPSSPHPHEDLSNNQLTTRIIVKKFESSNSRSSNDLCIKYINNKSEDKFVLRRMKHNKIKRSISGPPNNSPKIIDNSLLQQRKIKSSLSSLDSSKKGFMPTISSSFENINDSRKITRDNEEVETITTYEKSSADTTRIDKTHESNEQ